MRGLGCFVCPWVAASSVCCLWPHGCSGRRRARPPARLGDLTSFGAAPRSPPVPSGPSGALHTSGALSLMCAGGRRPSCLLLLVAPRAFRAPRGMSCGPGCFVCPWAAARPRAVRAASFARRVVSKPGQAPPPPTGTAAWPSNPSRCPPHQWGLCCCELLGQVPPPPTGPAPRPSGPSSGVRVLDRKFCCG